MVFSYSLASERITTRVFVHLDAVRPTDYQQQEWDRAEEHATRQRRERNAVKKPDLRSLRRLAEKNREASKAAQDAAEGGEATGKKGKRREAADERPTSDPRYEGADRLFAEMKKKDRP